MRILLSILTVSLGLSAQTQTSLKQLKTPTPTANPIGLAVIMSDNSLQTITLNPAMFQIVNNGGKFLELRVVGLVPILTQVNVKLALQSDGNYAPSAPINGNVIPGSIEVYRNGTLQDDTDYGVVDTSKVLIKFNPPSSGGATTAGTWDPADKLSVRFQTR